MSKPDPILVKAANREFNRWANFLYRRPYTTRVVAEFVDEIEDAFEKIRDHPDRYPLEGYSDYRKIGPTPKHHFKVIYVVRNGGNVNCGRCSSCSTCALLGATKTQTLETQTLSGFLNGFRSRNAFFLAAHRLFQASIQVFSREWRTDRLGQMIDVAAN
jgi:hypothetical protein